MTYKLLINDNYNKTLTRVRKVIKSTKGQIVSLVEDEKFATITVETKPIIATIQKGGRENVANKMPAMPIRMDAPDRKPESVPALQKLPAEKKENKKAASKLTMQQQAEKNLREKSRAMIEHVPEKQAKKPQVGRARVLKITLPAELHARIMSGKQRMLSTNKNTRKNRYFQAKTPSHCKISLKGENGQGKIYMINKVTETAEAWHIHIQEYVQQKDCKHPPANLYTWNAGKILCVACCVCGAVLAGGMGYQGPF